MWSHELSSPGQSFGPYDPQGVRAQQRSREDVLSFRWPVNSATTDTFRADVQVRHRKEPEMAKFGTVRASGRKHGSRKRTARTFDHDDEPYPVLPRGWTHGRLSGASPTHDPTDVASIQPLNKRRRRYSPEASEEDSYFADLGGDVNDSAPARHRLSFSNDLLRPLSRQSAEESYPSFTSFDRTCFDSCSSSSSDGEFISHSKTFGDQYEWNMEPRAQNRGGFLVDPIPIDWTEVNAVIQTAVIDRDSIASVVAHLLTQSQDYGSFHYVPEVVPCSFKDAYRALFEMFSHQSWRVTERGGQIEGLIAIHIWGMVFRERCRFLDYWFAFLIETEVRYISRDSWNLFLDLTEAHGGEHDVSSYNVDGAWPVLFDEFVAWLRLRAR